MADDVDKNASNASADDQEEVTPGYVVPQQKSLVDIVKQDENDESLLKYKAALLGDVAATGGEIIINAKDPRRVIVTKMVLHVEDEKRPDIEIDLTADLTDLKKHTYTIKGGCQFSIQIHFYVQRDIVTGLKYAVTSHRGPLKVDKQVFMVGSYAPKRDVQCWTSKPEEAPDGMLARGKYTMKSSFSDDDKNEYMKWEWTLEIAKDWK